MNEFDLAWTAPLLWRGLTTACFVGGVIWLMERTSPFIGGIVLALPIVTAPAYLFLILLHPPVFVADAALASIATIGAVLLFLATVIGLIRRRPMPLVLSCALAVWCLTGLVTRTLPSGLASSLLILAAAAAFAWHSGRQVSLTAPAARSRSPSYEIVLRGGAAGLLVIGVTVLADILGSQVAGIFSSFPVALLTVCWFMPRRLDHAGIRAALRATQIGLASHLPFFLSMALLAPRSGAWPAFATGLLGSLVIAVTLALLRRHHLRRLRQT